MLGAAFFFFARRSGSADAESGTASAIRHLINPTGTPFTYIYRTAQPQETALDASMQSVVDACLIPAANAYGFDLYVNSGFRSIAEEDAIYALGRTEDGDVVSNARGGQSFHNYGLAVDVADHQNGTEIDYDILDRIGTWCGLEHNDRGYTDLPHFQHRGLLSLGEVQAGMRPEPLELPCELLKTKSAIQEAITKSDLASCGAPDFTQKVYLAPSVGYALADSTTKVPEGIPANWIRYDSNFGFSFWHPATWFIDDSYIAPFASIHDATVRYSNMVIAGSSAKATADVTAGPSVTINIASIVDQQRMTDETFTTSEEWLNKASTGLPIEPKAVVEGLTIQNEPAVRLSNLKVIIGEYQVTYLLQKDMGAAIRFDANYEDAADLSTLNTIIQSFTVDKELEG